MIRVTSGVACNSMNAALYLLSNSQVPSPRSSNEIFLIKFFWRSTVITSIMLHDECFRELIQLFSFTAVSPTVILDFFPAILQFSSFS